MALLGGVVALIVAGQLFRERDLKRARETELRNEQTLLSEAFEVRLSDESFETYELDPPPYTLDVTKKELKQIYYDMVAIR